MIPLLRRRLPALCTRPVAPPFARAHGTDNPLPANDPNPKPPVKNVSETNAVPTSAEGQTDGMLQESTAAAEERRVMQAPNRREIWSRSQKPRREAMVGPRFEQTIMEDQPRPYAAIELIHKQPVRWSKLRLVSCDGGGGPLGHPRVFFNLDRPRILPCSYCGLPFAFEGNRPHIEAMPSPNYPLMPTGDPAEVERSQKITQEPLAQR